MSREGVGAPQRGDGARLEALAELVDALGGVGAVPAHVQAAELIFVETAHTTGWVQEKCKMSRGINGLLGSEGGGRTSKW